MKIKAEAFDYYIGQTRVICNPKGYPGEIADRFRDNLIVEIKIWPKTDLQNQLRPNR